ncbi:MAG: MgtC/SapB family protein [Clostridiales bacterium]|nr:MgtC/SapB family protein [Clostridiales bacterium]
MDYFNNLYELNMATVITRIVLAVMLGGLIGLQRNITNHPIGFRTYILVCLGATLAMMTNQYMCDELGYQGDVARLGAQVITGVGFLGAGTILVTGRQKLKGLTTAAGLWASGCLGLALGIGFYEGAIIAALAIYLSLSFLERIEKYVYKLSRQATFYLEVNTLRTFKIVVAKMKELDCTVNETIFNSKEALTTGGIGIVIAIKLPKNSSKEDILDELENLEGLIFIDEM